MKHILLALLLLWSSRCCLAQAKGGVSPTPDTAAPRIPRSNAMIYKAWRYHAGDNPAWDTLDSDRRADLARRMAVFAAMVECMDRNIGRVIDDLKKNGELDNTLVFFLSDNGACAEWDPFGFDGASGPKNTLHKGEQIAEMGGPKTYHSYGSGGTNAGNTPFRLYKHECHEGGIRTPLIVHWPKGFAAKGEFRDQVVHLIDLMATCVEVGGAKYPTARGDNAITPMEGKSLVPALENKPLEREYLAWEHERNRAIRAGDWKLVSHGPQKWELFDMKSDPVELEDLSTANPDKVRELAAKWDEWAKRCQVLPYPGAKK